MQREIAKYLHDIRTSCELIAQFVEGKCFEDYSSEAMLKSAVERQFEIIGEALRQMLAVEPELKNVISSHSDIISFRNRLIHGYAQVSDELVWGVIERNLPTLLDEIIKLQNTA